MTKLLKNLMQGASTVFSITPPPRRRSTRKLYKPHKTAAEAIFSDWLRIGGDFNKVMKRVANVEE